MKNQLKKKALTQILPFILISLAFFMFSDDLVSQTISLFNNGFSLNFGYSIILSAVLIKNVLYILSFKDNVNSKKKKIVSPKLAALQKEINTSQSDGMTTKNLRRIAVKRELYRNHSIKNFSAFSLLMLIIQIALLFGFLRALHEYNFDGKFFWMTLSEIDYYYILPIVSMSLTFCNSLILNGFDKKVTSFTALVSLFVGLIIAFVPSYIGLYIAVNSFLTLIHNMISLKKAKAELKKIQYSPIVQPVA